MKNAAWLSTDGVALEYYFSSTFSCSFQRRGRRFLARFIQPRGIIPSDDFLDDGWRYERQAHDRGDVAFIAG